MFDLCECNKCEECNGIDVDRINFNLYKCNHNGFILYRYNSNSLVNVCQLEEDRSINKVKR